MEQRSPSPVDLNEFLTYSPPSDPPLLSTHPPCFASSVNEADHSHRSSSQSDGSTLSGPLVISSGDALPHEAATLFTASGEPEQEVEPGFNVDDPQNIPSDQLELNHFMSIDQGWVQIDEEELLVTILEALVSQTEQEMEIMFMDTSKLDDTMKNYVQQKRAQILASKRGGSGGGGENGSM